MKLYCAYIPLSLPLCILFPILEVRGPNKKKEKEKKKAQATSNCEVSGLLGMKISKLGLKSFGIFSIFTLT